MNNGNSSKFGSIMAIAAGGALLAGGASYLLWPSQMFQGSTSIYWTAALANLHFLQLTNLFFAAWALCTLGVIVAFAERIRTGDRLLARWVNILAIIGMSVGMASLLLTLHVTTDRAVMINGMYAGTPVAQILGYAGGASIDPNNEITFGFLGLWLLFVNWQALKQSEFPRLLAGLGLVAGILSWLFVAGNLLWVGSLAMIGKVGAVTVGPIWFIWLGIVLSREPAAESASTGADAPAVAKPSLGV